MNVWIEKRKDSRGGCKGYAEIFVSGGKFKYIHSTCVGRLYQAHLSDKQIETLYNAVAEALCKVKLK